MGVKEKPQCVNVFKVVDGMTLSYEENEKNVPGMVVEIFVYIREG